MLRYMPQGYRKYLEKRGYETSRLSLALNFPRVKITALIARLKKFPSFFSFLADQTADKAIVQLPREKSPV